MGLRRSIGCRLFSFGWGFVFLSLCLLNPAVSQGQDFSATTVGNYGDITVMEVVGNYDAENPDGSTNGAPRQEIAKEFYTSHPDTYDFLVILSNFDFQMPEQEVVAFYLGAKNDVNGLGLPVFDYSSFYGSNGKLQGTIDMGSVTNVVSDPLDPGFTRTMTTLAHEVLHRWAAHVKFEKDDGSSSTELLGSGGYHWSFLLDTSGSLLYGNRWQDNGDGTFTSLPGWKYYSPLDLYLMGLIDKSEVPPMLLIENADIDHQRLPETGVTVDGTARTVTVDDIIAAEGERIPGAEDSQKTFKMGFILITRPDTFSGDELNGIRSIMQNWVMWFSSLTDGRAMVQIDSAPLEDVPTNPGVNPPPYDPRTAPPEINDGVAWLISNQTADGSWVDLSQTSERDTAEAVLALTHFDIATDSVATGIGWLASVSRLNTDYLSRKIVAFFRAGMEVPPLVDVLLSRQNPDGGWGSDINYISNPADTSFALKALAVSGYEVGTSVEAAIEYLKLAQSPEGGWGSTTQASTIQATANVLSAFNLYRQVYSLEEEIQRGIAWLLSRQNSDGGFGNSPSTVYDSATALLTLKQFNVSRDITGSSLDYLRGLQSEDGGWYGSPYQTALAVSAIWAATIDPDLSLSTADISFAPPSVTSLPAQVEVSAEISNLGLTEVDQVKVALYETSVSEANRVGTQTLAVPGKSSVTATFTVTISDGNPHWYYVVADPDNLIPESSEANNKAIKVLYPETTYDLEILDISASPTTVDLSQVVTITSQVANNGAADAFNVPLRYYIDTAGGPFGISTVPVNVPAGTTIDHEITWTADRVGENLNLTVLADPFESFDELSEENNRAFTLVTIIQPTEPNLTVLHQDIQITPTPALESGSAQISAVVKNQGFSQADNVEVVFYKSVVGGDIEPLGSQMISSLAAGESTTIAIDWTNIMESGERIITVRVDPQDLVQETKEEDNSAFTTLQILSLPDLAVSTNSIVFEPPAPKDGDPVSIRVTVQNGGEQEVQNLILAVTVGTEIISAPPASISGNSQAALSFDYDTAGKSGIHQVNIVVDPDNQIQEQKEDNNSASRSFGVQDGDLWLTERYISPNGDGIKDITQFFFRLETVQTVRIVIRDEENEVVRTFTGEELQHTTGGTIEWDGRDDFGMVVDDGQYRLEVMGENDSVVAGLSVVVDTNRSPLTKAIGTEYLLNANLTCMLPTLNNYEWFLDDSGILLEIGWYDGNTPEYTPGFYSVAPDGEDIFRLVPWEWGQQDHPYYSYTMAPYAISPDREKVAFALEKYDKRSGKYEKRELWVVDRYGEKLVNLTSYNYSKTNERIENIKWSPDGETILYSVRIREYYSTNGYNTGIEHWLVRPDGTGKTRLHPQSEESSVYSRLEYLEWSPDSRTVAGSYRVSEQSGNTISNTIVTIDTSGNKQDVFELPHSVSAKYVEWLNDSKIIVKLADVTATVWLLDVSGQGNHVKIAEGVDKYTEEVTVSPTGEYFALIDTSTDSRTLLIYDTAGIGHTVIDSPGFDYEDTIIDVRWSPDGSKLAFFDRAYRELDPDLFEAAFVVADVRTMDVLAFSDGTWEYGGGYGYAAAQTVASDAGVVIEEESTYSSDSLQWFPDNRTLLARDGDGIFILSSRDGEKSYLPIEQYYYGKERISPLGRYVTYNLGVNSASICYPRGYRDVWAMSSLLNLTADLRISRDKSAIILKGIAADLNFVGYKLEYADINTPDTWNLVTPPANVPMINDVFAIWVPPYEGTFYVKLTVDDRAGNVAWERKRVSWGRFTSITNLYKTEEIFSPNSDGTKDTVELHYRVLEPVHLEFYILDENDTLLKTLYKDYGPDETFPLEDHITWDGKDENGSVGPDGKYTLRIFDYEFFFEVDTTPPDVDIEFGQITPDLTAHLNGSAKDDHFGSWLVEYGEGENPQDWQEYLWGSSSIPSGSTPYIKKFGKTELEFAVGKKFRLTAEDYAGNKSTAVSGFLEELLGFYQWDSEVIIRIDRDETGAFLPSGTIPSAYAKPGPHVLSGLETIRVPLASVKVQYRRSLQWLDDTEVVDPASGLLKLGWDNSSFQPEEIEAIRIKAVDLVGQEHFSNEVAIRSLFDISTECVPANSTYTQLLLEDLVLLKFQVRSSNDQRYSEWTDYQVFDVSLGDTIEAGRFSLPLPDTQGGKGYQLRMIATGVSGWGYTSGTASYPLTCRKVKLEPKVTYTEAPTCDSLAPGRATISAGIKIEGDGSGAFALKTLTYSMKEEGEFKLLRMFDIPTEGQGSVTLDTNSMDEGAYPIQVELEYEENGKTRRIASGTSLLVDRVLPEARITFPTGSTIVCPVQIQDPKRDWFGIDVEGLATDNRGVGEYELSYGVGEDLSGRAPAVTRVPSDCPEDSAPCRIQGSSSVQGRIGTWDVTSLAGAVFSLQLKVTDAVGNVTCFTTPVNLDTAVQLTTITDKRLFSPNGDGDFDEVEITYTTNEYSTLDVRVFKNKQLVRTILTGLQLPAGTESTFWDGRDDGGSVVPDGEYDIVVAATDSCGNSAEKPLKVEVDNTPPAIDISYPLVNDPLSIIVEVKGSVYDLNFSNYQVLVEGGTAAHSPYPIGSGFSPQTNKVLGTWNTYGREGEWILTLTAVDKVANKREIQTPVDLGIRQDLIKDLTVDPPLFSPNNDGKLDTTQIHYELTDECNLTIDIFNANDVLTKRHEIANVTAGQHTYLWDGTSTGGGKASDGTYKIELTAELSAATSTRHTESITVTVDSTPPILEISEPLDLAYLKDTLTVRGTVTDKNISEYSIAYVTDGGTELIDAANQERRAYTFGTIAGLPETSYTLMSEAKDGAGNTTETSLTFTIDRTPPELTLKSPLEGELFGSSKDTITIQGTIKEDNLKTYQLRYGAGPDPVQWSNLVTGDTLPSEETLFTWKVGKDSGIADGLYILSLYAEDKAGWVRETRLQITIDNTPPEVALTSPGESDYVKEAVDIQGTASDQNLEEYSIEIAAGECDSAFKWATIKTSQLSVQDGLLATWNTLPPDDTYCLRLTATDKVENSAEKTVNLTVDTQPPAPPVLAGEIKDKTDSQLSWTQNTEPDLAGYNLYRDNQKVNPELVAQTQFLEQDLEEAIYSYVVKAVDHAGWESEPSNEIRLQVDLTPPNVRISSPLDGDLVSDIVDIKGTAFSPDDFKEYRLYMGMGANPDSWTLLRTSPVPTSYDTLAQWDTVGLSEEQYAIKLEAEDLVGNINTHQLVVRVDNTPPTPPVLLSAVASDSDVDLTWNENTEADLAGYLLYRNHDLANVSGIVVGNLKPYLITGTTYDDNGLPDGTFGYYLVAMDEAGNISDQSNTIEVKIDTHPPSATIVEPEAGHRFETSLMIQADSADLDIASVQFQFNGTGSWTDLGPPVTSQPFVTYLDPVALGLAYGDYQLRALAKDETLIDDSPSSITVVYTDVTAPGAPQGLLAHTDGENVTLTWTANTEDDLDGYNLYRFFGDSRTRLNGTVLAEPTFQHQGLADGEYNYQVTAVDTYGNESEPSDPASATVYAPLLAQVYTPSAETAIQISGSNAAVNSTVDIFTVSTNGTGQTTVTAEADGAFVANINLALGLNSITATATDSSGNQSKTSEEVVVVYNEPPPTVTGLATEVVDNTVTVTWDDNAEIEWDSNLEPEPPGYNLYRDGVRLNGPSEVTEGIPSASYYNSRAYRAFDNNPDTYWYCYFYDYTSYHWWQINLDSPKLINRFELEWYGQEDSNLYAAGDYEIQVWSDDANGWLTLAKVSGNTSKVNTFDFSPAYRTARIRIYITARSEVSSSTRISLAEVRIKQENPIHERPYEDLDLADGEYRYQVTAVDYYGFESPLSDEVIAVVGDVEPPAPPQGLEATASGSDIVLNWTANDDPDLAGYNIFRLTAQGWIQLNPSLVTENTHRDSDLVNDTYTYRVTAVDGTDNESEPSDTASATVAISPPQQPLDLSVASVPEGQSLDICWEDGSGSSSGYNLYRSTSKGGPYEKVNEEPITETCYLDTGLTNGLTYYYVVVAVDQLGNESVYSDEGLSIPEDVVAPPAPVLFYPTISSIPLHVRAVETTIVGTGEAQSNIELFKNGQRLAEAVTLAQDLVESFALTGSDIDEASLSPDGSTVAYRRYESSPYYDYSIWLQSLETGESSRVSPRADSPRWSPDSSKLAYEFHDEEYNFSVGVYNLETGQATTVTDDSAAEMSKPNWSPDGSKLAYEFEDASGNRRIGFYDLARGQTFTVTDDSAANMFVPTWSADSTKLAYHSFDENWNSRIGVYNLETAQAITVTDDSAAHMYTPTWSPDGSKLAYEFYDEDWNSYIGMYHFAEGKATTVSDDSAGYVFAPKWSPEGSKLAYGFEDDAGQSGILLYDLSAGTTEPLAAHADAYLDDYLWSPDGTQIVYVLEDNQVWLAPVDLEDEGRLLQRVESWVDYLDWLPSGAIAYLSEETLTRIYLQGHFSFLGVPLTAGENTFSATATDAAGNLSSPSDSITLILDPNLLPDLQTLTEDIFIYPVSPIAGEETAITVFVRNSGPIDLEDVDVEIYILDSTGNWGLVTSEAIPSILADSSELIHFSWDTTGRTGVNEIVVILDPYDEIKEGYEDNNFATREFYVSQDGGMVMTTTLNGPEYSSNDNVFIALGLHNSGLSTEGVLQVAVEDENGSTVEVIETLETDLPYGSIQDYDLLWNTAITYAGSYRVRATLRNDRDVIAENIVPFSITPVIDIGSTLVTNKASYGPNEDVLLEVKVTNNGRNYNIAELTAILRITDEDGSELFTENLEFVNLLTGTSAKANSAWNTGLSLPGMYHAIVEVYRDGNKVSRETAPFTILTTVTFAGTIQVTPSVVYLDGQVQADYTTANRGNAAASGCVVDVVVFDPESQTIVKSGDQTIDLGAGETKSGQVVFSTEDFGLKTYQVLLQSSYLGHTKQLASGSFSVKDGAAPVVDIISPLSGSILDDTFDLAVSATDDASGVERVEYQVDGGAWKVMPASNPAFGKYVTRWEPVEEDEGTHTISFRAKDRAGNLSKPVSTTVTIELISPFEKLTGTLTIGFDPVYLGQEETFVYTITNQSNKDIDDLKVNILIVDPNSGAVQKTLGKTIDLEAAAITSGNFTTTTLDLAAQQYDVELQVAIAEEPEPRTLDQATFEVIPSLEISRMITDRTNLLVWVNDKCHDTGGCKHNHSYHWHAKDDEHNDEDSRWKDCVRLDLLKTILDEAVDSHLIVYDKKDFARELRNPFHTDILILGNRQQLDHWTGVELNERVYSGTGIISSLWLKHLIDLDAGRWNEAPIFGVKWKGVLPGKEHLVQTVASPITTEGSLITTGMAKKVEASADTTVAGWIEKEKAKHHKHWFKGKDPKCQQEEKYPAIVLNEYGLGKAIYYGFDLGLTFNDDNYHQIAELITKSIAHVHRPVDPTSFYPYQLVPLELAVKSLGGNFDVQVSETFPSELKLYDPLTQEWYAESPWATTLHLEPDETSTVACYYLTPDKPDSYPMATEVGFVSEDGYTMFQTVDSTIVVEKDRSGVIAHILVELGSLSVSWKDRLKLKLAIKFMERVQEGAAATEKDISKNINDTLKALDCLLLVRNTDVTEIRLMLDDLLRLEQSRYYHFVPPEEGLTGTLSASPDPVSAGEDVTFLYTITNDGTYELYDLTIRVGVVDPDSGKTKTAVETKIDLLSRSSESGSLTTSTLDLPAGDYDGVLEVSSTLIPEPKVLAISSFQIAAVAHPPTAVIGGPYLAVAGEEIRVDGSGSYDVDEDQSESGYPPYDTITAFDWESDLLEPYDFDEAHGETAVLPPFHTPGLHEIALRVTDNTAEAFPNTSQENLIHLAYGEVEVFNLWLAALQIRPKWKKNKLSWTDMDGDSYDILRSEKGPNESFTEIGTAEKNRFYDKYIAGGRNYWYRVRTEKDGETVLSPAVHIYSK